MKNGKKKSLLFSFSVLIIVFTITVLTISGVTTYFSQAKYQAKHSMKDIKSAGEYLEQMILSDQDAFEFYQDYYIEHYEEINIPYDFDEYVTAREEFLKLFAKKYGYEFPGGPFKYEDMDAELQKAFFIYYHEYWLLTFEQAREAFDMPYSYYLLLYEDGFRVVYMIDGERTPKETSEGKFLYLGDVYTNDPAIYDVEWATWRTGEKQDAFQEWDNKWGHTYAYYTPLNINGETKGLIGTEIEVARVNREVLETTIKLSVAIAAAVIFGTVIILIIINNRFIRKIGRLEAAVHTYTDTKDASVSEVIAREAKGRDEVSSLARQVASMVIEMENYVRNLVKTTHELKSAKKLNFELSASRERDTITGIRNRTAYDLMSSGMDREIKNGVMRFGIAIVSLTSLKVIKDSFGEDKANQSVKKLCAIVCEIFDHSPVFRIDNEDFAIVLRGGDYDKAGELVAEFNSRIAAMRGDRSLEPWEKVAAVIGVSKYDSSSDTSVEAVLNRAMQETEERKRDMICNV